ncbi:PDZ domain-containing protein [Cohnella fermenti]|uniref:PDZ domain-containing protein n=1 Tax=Cohnella fermenti TaxID=2565925 RepID=A0A4S4BZK3_9BACL|nr:PDZ domain-containing protein [Cohnella fermenti]THF80746.1 PDZ domain-containing protein [Cohnella fermenti]
MNSLMDVLGEAGQALAALLASPFLYLAVLLAWWHAKQEVVLQRAMFHVRLYSSLTVAFYRTLAGIGAGVVLSVLSLGTGGRLDEATLVCLWIALPVLALLRLRYVCIAYGAGALGVVQQILEWSGVSAADGAAAKALLGIDVPALLVLAGLLHIGEGLLVRWQGSRFAVPLFLEGKRGKPVGAFALSGLWPVPLLWLVPATGTAGGFSLPWTPLSDLDGSVASWALLGFPVLIGFTDRTTTKWPEIKARELGWGLIVYGVVIAGLAAGAWYWQPLAIVAAIAAFALHEGLLLWGRSGEAGREPLFAQNGRGVTVLAVLPGTPAAELGFLPGEKIMKANGQKIGNKEQLHEALQLQAAYYKLEIANRDGEVRFAQRARYAGEPHQLGLILAPDEDADWVAAPRSGSIWQGLQRAGAKRRPSRRGALAAKAAEEANGASGELAAGEAARNAEAAGDSASAASSTVPATGPAGPATAPAASPETKSDPNALPPRRARSK